MKKTFLLSVSLLALCTACSVESDSVESVTKMERAIPAKSAFELSESATVLTQLYLDGNYGLTEISDIAKTVEGLAVSGSFAKEEGLDVSQYKAVSVTNLSQIIDQDWSVLNEITAEGHFKQQIIKMVESTDGLESFINVITNDKDLTAEEKQLLHEGIKMGTTALEGGIDDEWGKRKFTGYILSRQNSELNVVVTRTVLNIAMKQ
ncbi:hypothetical protein [Flavobacterium sp. JP2137]|uniref:hypothetical protein n=1 Tax=Flavobacterium sp. JP2137 TaxID=3414510 RepID=UPI003D2FA2B2